MFNWFKNKISSLVEKSYFGFLRDIVGLWGRSNYKNNYTYANFVQLCNDTYNTSPEIQEAVNLIAKESSELPICYKDEKGNKVDNFAPTKELKRFLARPMSNGGDLPELFRLLYLSWVISGEMFLIKKQGVRFSDKFSMGKPIDSVMPVKPNFVTELRYVDGTPSEIKIENTYFNEINGINSQGGVSTNAKNHFGLEYFDGYLVGQVAFKMRCNLAVWGRGLGLMIPIINDIEILKRGREFNRNAIENQGRPSGVFFYPARTRAAQAGSGGRVGGGSSTSGGGSSMGNKVTAYSDEEDIARNFSGVENAKNFLFLKGGLDFKETQKSMVDLDFIPGLKFCRTSIASLFGIPPELYGDTDSSTFSNRREAKEFFIGNTCVSTMNDFLKFFSDQVLRPHFKEFGELKMCVDEAKLDETISKKFKLWEGLEKNHNLTVNEKRELCDLKPSQDENADTILVPSGLTPITDLGLNPDMMNEDGEEGDEDDSNNDDDSNNGD